eukprot:gnl/Spiro4/10162_TR5398_c0_g1_i1.p1 gnl/Spiro4/10162_TR5398_c0_g1~~gnl/Spiro4/10162_TR5398_c0_g1_i1.p1  ORF type:complete len:182 (-),score=38.79 gnl/Spiro4/10162_TR5398_c0_g1_i1:26-571(-)
MRTENALWCFSASHLQILRSLHTGQVSPDVEAILAGAENFLTAKPRILEQRQQLVLLAQSVTHALAPQFQLPVCAQLLLKRKISDVWSVARESVAPLRGLLRGINGQLQELESELLQQRRRLSSMPHRSIPSAEHLADRNNLASLHQRATLWRALFVCASVCWRTLEAAADVAAPPPGQTL